MRSGRLLRTAAAAALAACLPGGAARGQDETPPGGPAPSPPAAGAVKPLAEQVGEAIDRGVVWLRAKQRKDGTWGRIGGETNYEGGSDFYAYPAGPTAFALYTLLKCGVPPTDEVVQRGFAAIRKIGKGADSTYEHAATLLALEAKYDPVKRERRREADQALRAAPGKRPDLRVKPSDEDKASIRALVQGLDERFNEGGWRYFKPGHPMAGAKRDQSATAMALLGYLAAHRCGVDAPRKTLVSAVEWTIAQQDESGPAAGSGEAPAKPGATSAAVPLQARGWPYVRGGRSEVEPGETTGNMTAAGIVTLLAAQHILEDTSPEAARALGSKIDRAVNDGIAWLGSNWSVTTNPGNRSYHLMYLYGLERVGDLKRVALLAGHDWYTEGAEHLVSIQAADGSWNTRSTHPPQDTLDTCFALLFLDRASFVAAVTGK
jgi:hypothetical protein